LVVLADVSKAVELEVVSVRVYVCCIGVLVSVAVETAVVSVDVVLLLS
jgi:hypothetical protein